MLDLQPLIQVFFQVYGLSVADATNRDEVITRCKNLVLEESAEFEEARLAFRRRRSRANRVHLAGEAADVRYVVNYTSYALDIPLVADAPGHGATFAKRVERIEQAFDELLKAEPGSAEEESVRIHLAMELSHMDVMVFRDAWMDGQIPLDSIVEAVHSANLRKIWPDGTIHYREDGKVIKPPEWVPADLESILFPPVDDEDEVA